MVRLACLFGALALACGSSHPAAPQAPSNRATADKAEDPGTHVTLAGIRRTGCLGTCPIYEVHVYRDGTVEYEGTAFVKVQSRATGQLTPAQLAELEALFTSNGFMQLRDAYDNLDETDAPSVYSSYRPPGGLEKQVNHYYGDEHAPAVLKTIEDGIDRIVHVEQWIGTEQEREALFRH